MQTVLHTWRQKHTYTIAPCNDKLQMLFENLAQHRHPSRERRDIFKHELDKKARWVQEAAKINSMITVGLVTGRPNDLET